MKKVVFIGSRLNVLQEIGAFSDLKLVGLFVQRDSLLHNKLHTISLPDGVRPRIFEIKEKIDVFKEISGFDFDIIISNGCPLIFPVSEMKKQRQLFINIHPTILPYLKGKTPLNGVFMTHQKAIGATMHYIDDGIDTGNIIEQQQVPLSSDIDQGLVYKISFDLEGVVFRTGMRLLVKSNYEFTGAAQSSAGSYFNRTDELQKIEIEKDSTDLIIDKIKSFGIKSQGSFMEVGNITYKIYAAEKIFNEYLLATYANLKAGKKVFEYEDRVLFKTIDGIIKLIDYEMMVS